MLGFDALPDGTLGPVLLSVLLVIRDGKSRGIEYRSVARELPPVGDGAGRTPPTSPSAGTV